MLPSSSTYAAVPAVIAQETDDAVVLLHTETGAYYSLNAVAGRIFAMCDGVHTVEAMVDAIVAAFDVPVERVRRDVVVTLDRLADAGLVAPSGAHADA